MEEKNKKKNIIVPIIIAIAVITLISTIILLNTNTSKIKRYLSKEGYECSNVECVKVVNNYQMIINTKDLYLTATNDTYIIKVNNKGVLLQKRTDKSTCSYTKYNYRINQLIDENFEYTVYCQEHIKEINEVLEVYRDILTSSKVRLSK